MPEVSVYMTCYNASLFIEECIESILLQSFQDFELVIVDDGSTDDTIMKIRKFNDKKVRLIPNNHRYIQSLNLAVTESKGKYVAKMDADDIMMPDRLLIQYNYLEHNEDIHLLAGGMEFFGDRGGSYIPKVNASSISREELLENNIIAHPTVMMRRDAIKQLPCLYEEEYIYAEDYKLWFTMLQHNLILDNIPDILLRYRVNKTQVSCVKKQQQWETVKKIKSIYAAPNPFT